MAATSWTNQTVEECVELIRSTYGDEVAEYAERAAKTFMHNLLAERSPAFMVSSEVLMALMGVWVLSSKENSWIVRPVIAVIIDMYLELRRTREMLSEVLKAKEWQ